jgi:hypothetical protein
MMTSLRAGGRALVRRASDRTGVVLALVGTAMVVAYLAAQVVFRKPDGRVVFGDATHHFVQLRSVVFDRDLDFRNEYVRIYGLRGGEPGTEWIHRDLTPTGHVRNYMPVGPAMLWAPLYLVLAGVQIALATIGLAGWPDGFERVLQIAPGVTGVIAATGGAWLSWRLARRYTDAASASVAVFGVWLGSSALYYSLVSPAYSHSASMLVSSAFFLHWLSTREQPTLRRFAEWGALAGIAALMRWQDALFLVVPAIEALSWRARAAERLKAAMVAGLAWLIAFSPQMVVWDALYGQPLAVPQGAGFLQWTRPHLFDVLFSDNHGLFTWTPIVLLSVAGLARFARRTPGVTASIAAVVLASWYVNAAVADWWAGEAFGARRFLSLFPLFTLGLAVWIGQAASPRARTVRLVAVWVLVGANLLLLLQYQVFMKGLPALAPYPRNWADMWIARFVVPVRLWGWWWQ